MNLGAFNRLRSAPARHPIPALIAWMLCAIALAIPATQVEHHVVPQGFDGFHGEAAAATRLAHHGFGEQELIPVLLRGEARTLDRRGPQVAAALRDDRALAVVSPWDDLPGNDDLKPQPDAALLLVRAVEHSHADPYELTAALRGRIDRLAGPSLHAHIPSATAITLDGRERTFAAMHTGEVIAIPLLLIVLLIVFRSVVAALVPAIVGGVTVLMTTGVVALLADVTPITELALPMASIMGLALGVDYALLVVSRFREELEHLPPQQAAVAAALNAGTTVIVAGSVLAAVLVAVLILAPHPAIASPALAILLTTLLSVMSAAIATPAALALLGDRINALAISDPTTRTSRWTALSRWSLSRPRAALAVVVGPAVALGAAGLGVTLGGPGIDSIPTDTRAYRDVRALDQTMGPGWSGAYQLIVAVPGSQAGPITTTPRLRAINAAERQLSRNPSVVTVIGPGALLDAERRYRSLRTALRDPGTARQRQIDSLQSRMHRAGNGFDTLVHGLRDASGAAGQLSAGATDAADGGSQLAGGLAQARDGAAQATTALTQARSGSAQLQKGLGAAQRGSGKLQGALDAAAKEVAAGLPQLRSLASSLATGADELAALSVPATQAAAQAAALQQSLKHASAESADPVLAQAAADAERLHALLVGADLAGGIDEASTRMRTAGQTQRTFAASVERLERGLRTMSSSTAALTAGIGRLRSGAGDLTTGIGIVQRGGRQLTNGLTDLDGGATALAGGLIQLRAGGGQLAAGLDTGNGRAAAAGQELTRLQRSANALIADQHRQQRLLDQLRRQSPDAAQSGYVALAGIDGARAATHARGALVVGVERGGRVARITVVPKDRLYTAGSRATERALQKADSELTRAGLVAHVGGDAGALNSYVDVTSTRLPLTIAVVTVLSFFMLVLLLRAPLLALLSVILNLLTVAAAYGTIALLFGGQHPPLGGPGYIDATTAYMVFVVLYGLSIDYQVFILSRVQEALAATPDDPIGAVTAGIDRTARVVTSAAAIMAIVFLVFALVGFANLAQLGTAVTFAVLLDATVVRLMLLPAALRLLGARAFWTPSCAARVLPRLAH